MAIVEVLRGKIHFLFTFLLELFIRSYENNNKLREVKKHWQMSRKRFISDKIQVKILQIEPDMDPCGIKDFFSIH